MKEEAQSSDTRSGGGRTVRAIVGASSGNLVEWYDFYTYSFTSLYFAAAFFPSGDRTSQLLNTSGIFAAGFLMRPVGGWLFGRLADRYGRRLSMMVSVLLMSAGSLAIAVLPTYATIGRLAPLLLLLARLVQGLSVGGEYGTSATYMSEVALPGRRGFYASFQYVTLIGGQLVAVLTLVVLQTWLTTAELRAWGWRVPFAIGAVAALVVLFLRSTLVETAPAESLRSAQAGTLRALSHYRRSLVTVLGITAGGSLLFYTYTTYMQKYLVNTAGMDARAASRVITAALLVFMLLQPLFGALSDRIGRRTSMIAFGLFATLTTLPLMHALGRVTTPAAAFALILTALTGLSFYTAISGLVKAELFPAEVRALGVGLPYAVANALVGGTAEYAALWLKSRGHEGAFFWYVTAFGGLALVTALWMRDPRTGGYLRADDAAAADAAPDAALRLRPE
ncbi:MAG: MFS family transporter [Acidobacteriota bacterium]